MNFLSTLQFWRYSYWFCHLFLCLWTSSSLNSTNPLAAFDLPVFPPDGFDKYFQNGKVPVICNTLVAITSSEGIIPQNLWIAVKNITGMDQWPNIKEEIKINPDWKTHICDNNQKDAFINEYFAGTSLQWAYNNINHKIAGAAMADIWRYAALFVFGGVYIDADSQLTFPLKDIIRPNDEMIITFERNVFEGDWCYSPNGEFAPINIAKRYPHASKMNLFNGRIITNWCIMSASGHWFLKQALESFVALMKLEYIGLSALKISKWDPFSKYVHCTTGPSLLTASSRKALIEAALIEPQRFINESLGQHRRSNLRPRRANGNQTTRLRYGYRLASRDFLKEGGVFKAINNVKEDKSHYTQIHPRDSPSFLREYAPREVQSKVIMDFANDKANEGMLIKGVSERSVYVLENGRRRQVGGMHIFQAMNWSLDNIVHASDFVIDTIPKGEMLSPPKS